jgi:hypothetical protein
MKFALSLLANASAVAVLVSYAWLLWCNRERRELPTFGVYLFLGGMLGLVVTAVLIFVLHYILKVI